MSGSPTVLRQVGALPFRRPKGGGIEVLLVTSRRTGRWIIPKGHIDPGRDEKAMARIEAFEEAGVEGKVLKRPIGDYDYDKYCDDALIIPAVVTVYPLSVQKLRSKWPEMNARERRWMSLYEASERVEEPGLAALMLAFAATATRE
jgi:8-oxo-dGTP pyrophosphatase MutT (NUDIX family)